MVAEALDHLGARRVAATCYPQCLVERNHGPIILEVPTTRDPQELGTWSLHPIPVRNRCFSKND